MFDLNPEILAEFIRLKDGNFTHSQVMRHIFLKYGEISPPIMAHYFKAVYGFQASDFLPALASWWPDNSSDISDSEFDRLILAVLAEQ